MLETKLDKWLENERQKGMQQEKTTIILKMLQQGLPIDTIMSVTGSNKEEIQKLRQE